MRKVSTVAEPLAELIRRARQSADEHLPLPTVEELARPMLETIYEFRGSRTCRCPWSCWWLMTAPRMPGTSSRRGR